MAIDRGADRLRPGEQLRPRSVATFGGQGLCDVDDGAGMDPEFRQLFGQRRRSPRIRGERGPQRVERLVQLLRGNRMGTEIAAERGQ